MRHKHFATELEVDFDSVPKDVDWHAIGSTLVDKVISDADADLAFSRFAAIAKSRVDLINLVARVTKNGAPEYERRCLTPGDRPGCNFLHAVRVIRTSKKLKIIWQAMIVDHETFNGGKHA